MEWIKKLFSKNRQKSLNHQEPLKVPIYKILTLKGDTFYATIDDVDGRRVGPLIRPSYKGAVLNPEVKVNTTYPWTQIAWMQESGEIEIK